MDPAFLVHKAPVWGRQHNYVASIDLGPFGHQGHREQVPLLAVHQGEFELCCIPLRAYGLALGDVVTVDGDSVVTALVRPSRRRTLWVTVTDRKALVASVEADGLLHETDGRHRVAVDVPPGHDVGPLLAAVAGSDWEWSDARPFSA